VAHHLICLTIDTDPDGLNRQHPDRASLEWDGLQYVARELPERIDRARPKLGDVPVTWYVRADGQLEFALGSALWLLEEFESFFRYREQAGDEIGWHPHLYRCDRHAAEPVLIGEPEQACDELNRIWDEVSQAPFRWRSFRNGEGWHHPATLDCVEDLGFACDSTAIPGRVDSPRHPRDWAGAPNQPYFPARDDIRQSGPPRRLLEVPMNSLRFRAPYDARPKLRYMNPAVHPELFADGLDDWEQSLTGMKQDLPVWVLILHPDELLPLAERDQLYAHDMETLTTNLVQLTARIRDRGDTLQFATVSQAAERWRAAHCPEPA